MKNSVTTMSPFTHPLHNSTVPSKWEIKMHAVLLPCTITCYWTPL